MTEKERATAKTLGRLGAAAYGLVCVVIGWFVLQAALFHDPKQAKGIVGAFNALAQQPAGPPLLGPVPPGLLGPRLAHPRGSPRMRQPARPRGGRRARPPRAW